MTLVYIEKKRVPGNLLYLLEDPAPESFAGGIQQRCRAQTGWWDSCSEQQQARAQLPKITGTQFSTAAFPSCPACKAPWSPTLGQKLQHCHGFL